MYCNIKEAFNSPIKQQMDQLEQSYMQQQQSIYPPWYTNKNKISNDKKGTSLSDLIDNDTDQNMSDIDESINEMKRLKKKQKKQKKQREKEKKKKYNKLKTLMYQKRNKYLDTSSETSMSTDITDDEIDDDIADILDDLYKKHEAMELKEREYLKEIQKYKQKMKMLYLLNKSRKNRSPCVDTINHYHNCKECKKRLSSNKKSLSFNLNGKNTKNIILITIIGIVIIIILDLFVKIGRNYK